MRALRLRLPALLLLALFAVPVFAFEARLVDRGTGAPIAGATITVVGKTGTATTDADGRFSWQPSPSAPFELVVVLPGGEVARPVSVATVDHAAVTTIAIEPLLDESLTVAGVAPSIDAAPAAGMTLLSGTQVARRAPANLMQTLESVPGVTQVSEGQAAVPAVRGLARGRTLILVDGGRVTSERRVGPAATFLDPSVIEGVDVARGPGSVAYGSDALGGVISVRTRRATPGSPFGGRMSVTFGTGVPETRGSLEITQGFAHGGVLLQAHGRAVEDWRGPDGRTVYNSGFNDHGVLLRFDHDLAGGSLSVGYQADFGRNIERPRNNSRVTRFFYPFENSQRFTAAFERGAVGGLDKIALSAFLGTYEQRTDQERFPTASVTRSIDRSDVSARDFHVRGAAETHLGRTRLEFGVDANGRFGLAADEIRLRFNPAGDVTTFTKAVAVDDARRIDTGLFVQAQTKISPVLFVSGGLRGDRVASRNQGGYFGDRSTSHTALSGFGAVTLGPFAGFSATAQYSRGFRDPLLSDRYYRGPTGRGFITGNPDLDPERSAQYDLALRYGTGPVRVALYAYEYRITDLVERFSVGTDLFEFRNRGEARLRGLELEAQFAAGHGLSFELAAARGRGKALADALVTEEVDLDDIAPDNASLTVRQEFGGRGYASLRLARFLEDDRPGPTELQDPFPPAYTLVDLGAGWRVSNHFELRGLLRNALDADYLASPDTRWVYAAGRSANVTAVVSF